MTDRDVLRQKCADRGAFYNPWAHLAVTSISGLAVMGIGAWMIHDLKWWQVAFGVALFILSNAAEWRMHRDLLHKRVWFAPQKLRDRARRQVYETAARECNVLLETMAATCRLENVNSNLNVTSRQYNNPNQIEGFTINGTMSYQITLK